MRSEVLNDQCSWFFVFSVEERKLSWKIIYLFDFFGVDVKFTNKLVFVFTLFFPIPALDFELSLASISKKFAGGDLKRFPIRT